MTLDERQRRDEAIARLEALGPRRTANEHDELMRLENLRDQQWRYHARAIERTRRKLHELLAYAAQHRLPIPGEPA